jgi:hypothetical protein
MSAETERARRLLRAAEALETRRRAAAVRLGAIEAEIDDVERRTVEMVEWMAAMAGESRILLAATHRLADLQAQLRRLEAEREATRRAMLRDRRISRGVERAAERLETQARRKAERAALEAYVDGAYGRPRAG